MPGEVASYFASRSRMRAWNRSGRMMLIRSSASSRTFVGLPARDKILRAATFPSRHVTTLFAALTGSVAVTRHGTSTSANGLVGTWVNPMLGADRAAARYGRRRFSSAASILRSGMSQISATKMKSALAAHGDKKADGIAAT